MEIKIKNHSLENTFNSKNHESDMEFIYPALLEFKKLKAPVNVAYNIVKSIKVVEQACKDYNDTRISICESLCEKDETGKTSMQDGKYKLAEENTIEFQNKWEELLNTEIILDIFPVRQSELKGINEVNICCYETLMRTGFIIDDTKVEVKPVIANGKADKKEALQAE